MTLPDLRLTDTYRAVSQRFTTKNQVYSVTRMLWIGPVLGGALAGITYKTFLLLKD